MDTFLAFPSWLEGSYVARVAMAVIVGGAIGLEREVRDKPAGFRTIILICVGACMFGILSQICGGPEHESTRIAAQVVTGIGFLGAGAILRDRHSVIGLTTAATIWAVAAVGLAVGFGHLDLALAGTVVCLITLWGFSVVEDRIGDLRDLQEYSIAVPKNEEAFNRLFTLFRDARLRLRKRSWHVEGEMLVVYILAMGAKRNHDRLRLQLANSAQYILRRP